MVSERGFPDAVVTSQSASTMVVPTWSASTFPNVCVHRLFLPFLVVSSQFLFLVRRSSPPLLNSHSSPTSQSSVSLFSISSSSHFLNVWLISLFSSLLFSVVHLPLHDLHFISHRVVFHSTVSLWFSFWRPSLTSWYTKIIYFCTN